MVKPRRLNSLLSASQHEVPLLESWKDSSPSSSFNIIHNQCRDESEEMKSTEINTKDDYDTLKALHEAVIEKLTTTRIQREIKFKAILATAATPLKKWTVELSYNKLPDFLHFQGTISLPAAVELVRSFAVRAFKGSDLHEEALHDFLFDFYLPHQWSIAMEKASRSKTGANTTHTLITNAFSIIVELIECATPSNLFEKIFTYFSPFLNRSLLDKLFHTMCQVAETIDMPLHKPYRRDFRTNQQQDYTIAKAVWKHHHTRFEHLLHHYAVLIRYAPTTLAHHHPATVHTSSFLLLSHQQPLDHTTHNHRYCFQDYIYFGQLYITLCACSTPNHDEIIEDAFTAPSVQANPLIRWLDSDSEEDEEDEVDKTQLLEHCLMVLNRFLIWSKFLHPLIPREDNQKLFLAKQTLFQHLIEKVVEVNIGLECSGSLLVRYSVEYQLPILLEAALLFYYTNKLPSCCNKSNNRLLLCDILLRCPNLTIETAIILLTYLPFDHTSLQAHYHKWSSALSDRRKGIYEAILEVAYLYETCCTLSPDNPKTLLVTLPKEIYTTFPNFGNAVGVNTPYFLHAIRGLFYRVWKISLVCTPITQMVHESYTWEEAVAGGNLLLQRLQSLRLIQGHYELLL